MHIDDDLYIAPKVCSFLLTWGYFYNFKQLQLDINNIKLNA